MLKKYLTDAIDWEYSSHLPSFDRQSQSLALRQLRVFRPTVSQVAERNVANGKLGVMVRRFHVTITIGVKKINSGPFRWYRARLSL